MLCAVLECTTDVTIIISRDRRLIDSTTVVEDTKPERHGGDTRYFRHVFFTVLSLHLLEEWRNNTVNIHVSLTTWLLHHFRLSGHCCWDKTVFRQEDAILTLHVFYKGNVKNLFRKKFHENDIGSRSTLRAKKLSRYIISSTSSI